MEEEESENEVGSTWNHGSFVTFSRLAGPVAVPYLYDAAPLARCLLKVRWWCWRKRRTRDVSLDRAKRGALSLSLSLYLERRIGTDWE
jgi:hypothetical protein